MEKTFKIDLPINIGDKVWLCDNNGFGSCNFMDRYKQYSEYTVTNVFVKFSTKTGENEIVFMVDGKDHGYMYTPKIAFTKEQLYEKFRAEIEELIPQDLRNYLWNSSTYAAIVELMDKLEKDFGDSRNNSTFNDALKEAIGALKNLEKFY